jgi:hypothetical protein
MRTKTLVLALGLAVLAVAASTTYVLAYRGSSRSYYGVTESRYADEEWWQEMQTYMEQRGQDNKDDAWWNEMRTHMEQHWGDIESDGWWNEMRQYMEEHWAELDNGDYSYGRYGGCGGMRW